MILLEVMRKNIVSVSSDLQPTETEACGTFSALEHINWTQSGSAAGRAAAGSAAGIKKKKEVFSLLVFNSDT